jgi:serine/threonine-protein kinase
MNSPLQKDNWLGRCIGERQRYRLEQHLGAGGMGDVFVARDVPIGKLVALKILKGSLAGSADLRKRFEREVTLCAALKSDHIVNISDYGVTDEGYPFYVMEYLQGQSLGQLLRQQRLGVERSVSIAIQVCQGLRLAHQGVTLWQNGATSTKQIKVVHRDLKPDNIFLVPTALGELVKILDFGIAKICNDTNEFTNLTNVFIGTFHYAAPEQFELGTEVDERADIYSLGVILYEMLSGTDPFGFDFYRHRSTISGMSWVFAHASKPPIHLRSQPNCGHFSLELEAVVMRCLQKSPRDRFASVDDLSRALQAAVAIELANNTTVPLGLDAATTISTLTPPTAFTSELTTTQLPEPTFLPNFTQRPFTPSLPPEATDGSLSAQQRSLLKIFTEFAGPIAPIVFRQVVVQAYSIEQASENLAVYLSPQQQVAFERQVKALKAEPTAKPQTNIHKSNINKFSNNSARSALDASFIQRCEKNLIDLIGPIAPFLIQKVLKSGSQISELELVNILANEIPDPQKAADFCRRLLK